MNFKVFLKAFGLVSAGFGALFALVIGFIFITGGFKPPYVPPTGIYFALTKDATREQEVTFITIDEDIQIFVLADPENATELDIKLHITYNGSIISIEPNAIIGEPILISILKDAQENNKGGFARIRATQDIENIILAEIEIFVDIPIENFDLSPNLSTGVYVGDAFTLAPTSLYPLNSFKPSDLNENYNRAAKQVKYYSSNPSVATVHELTGVVNALTEGNVEIEARVIKTYNLIDSQPSMEDFEYEEDYWEAMDLISVVVKKALTVRGIEVHSMQVNDNIEVPLYELDLHKEHIFTPQDFGLKLMPNPESSFSFEQLDYKLKDLDLTPMHKDMLNPELYVENPNLEVEVLQNPLRYKIRAINFETWENRRPAIEIRYNEDIFALVHFKILRNDVTGINITTNTLSGIELVLDPPNTKTFNLEANTTLVVANPNKPATYGHLIYRIDLAEAKNDLGEWIVNVDPQTGYITNNIITPLNRGTTKLKALIIETNVNKEPILDEDGNYIILLEALEYVNVSVLEQLKTLGVSFKESKVLSLIRYEEFEININLDAGALQAYQQEKLSISFDNLHPVSTEIETELVGNTLTIRAQGVELGSTKLLIKNLQTNMITDYVQVNVVSGTAGGKVRVFGFNYKTPTYDNQEGGNLIRGSEGFLVLNPNSHGALIDAYKYGKLKFIATPSPVNAQLPMLEITSSLDANDNLIVRLVAIHFYEDSDISYSMVRAYLTDSPGQNLINFRIQIDIGAVNGIHLSLNSGIVWAVPSEDGSQWLIELPSGQVGDEKLIPTVTFSSPERPAVTGVQYISSNLSILEIDNSDLDASGNPRFIFKKAGLVTLRVKSLDPFAYPTNPNIPSDGAYAEVTINVKVPSMTTNFRYYDLNNRDGIDYESVVGGTQIDLLEKIFVGGTLSRITLLDAQNNDRTGLLKFELEGQYDYLDLEEIPATQTTPRQMILSAEQVGQIPLPNHRIRLYTDFGFEAYYYFQILPDIKVTITYPDGGNSPEIVTDVQESFNIFDRVSVTDLNGEDIEGLEFMFSDENLGLVSLNGDVIIFSPNTGTEPIDFYITIRKTFDSGINFERDYHVRIMPNTP